MTDNHLEAVQKIADARMLVERVLAGERPTLSQEHDGWLIEMMQRMMAEQYIIDAPSTLARIEGVPYGQVVTGGTVQEHQDAQGEQDYVIKSNFHPVSEFLLKKRQMIHNALGEQAAAHVYVCGAEMQHRAIPHEAYSVLRQPADAYVVPEGDLYSLRDMLEIMQHNLEHPDDQKKMILQSKQKFWKPVVLHLGVELEAAGVNLQESSGAALDALKTLEIGRDPHVNVVSNPFHMPPGSTVFVATKTKNKLAEIATIFEGSGIRVMKLENLTNFSNPPEISGTYGGNTFEKLESAGQWVDQHIVGNAENKSRVDAMMRSNGVDPNTAFILSEDSGMHFKDARVLPAMIRQGALTGMKPGLIVRAEQFPGQEFGPSIFGKLGEEAFFSAAHKVIFEHNEAHPEDKMDTSLVNNSTMGIMKLFPAADGSRQKYMFSGSTELKLVKDPAALKAKMEKKGFAPILTTKDYLVPAEANMMMPQTIRELDRLYSDHPNPHTVRDLSHSALYGHKAHAAQAVMLGGGLDPHRVYGLDLPNEAEQPSSTLSSALHISLLGDAAHHLVQQVRGQMQPIIEQLGMNSSMQPVHNAQGKDWAQHIRDLVRSTDAFLFLPQEKSTPESAPQDLYDKLFTFFSVIVARQLTPLDMEKPFIVMNEHGCHDDLMKVYHDMRETAMLPDPDQDFVKEVRKPEEIIPILKFAKHSYWDAGKKEEMGDLSVKDITETGKFNVAVFCSASAKNERLNDQSKELGKFLAEQNCGVVFGAGDRFMMGSVLRGALEAETAQRKTAILGSSTPDIIGVESDNVEKLKADVASHGQYFDAKDIYQRMDYMIKASDAFVILPGGAGTVQELALLLKLKHENKAEMQGKDVVIYDPSIAEMTGAKGDGKSFYGALLEMIPQAERDRLHLHVCKSLEEVEREVAVLKQTSGRNTHEGVVFPHSAFCGRGMAQQH